MSDRHRTRDPVQPKKWTDDDKRLLAALYPHTRTKAVAKLLGRTLLSIDAKVRRLGLKKTAEYMKTRVPRFDGKGGEGLLTRYSPGYKASENDGIKPHGWQPIGTISTIVSREHVYASIKVSETGIHRVDWRPAHVVVWEQRNGPIPDGHVITFIDGDKSNFTLDNLACISRGELCFLNASGYHELTGDLRRSAIALARLSLAAKQKGKDLK